MHTDTTRSIDEGEHTMETTGERRSEHMIGGLILISIGSIFLVSQFIDVGSWLLPSIALVFLAAGIATRQAGYFIPCGVIGGITFGSAISDAGIVGGDAEGGLFLLAFATGWVSIALLSKLFATETLRWALIPGGVMALIGGAVLAGDMGLRWLSLGFTVFNYIWPLLLVGFGVYVLVQRRRNDRV